jgi:hypothetical protein
MAMEPGFGATPGKAGRDTDLASLEILADPARSPRPRRRKGASLTLELWTLQTFRKPPRQGLR